MENFICPDDLDDHHEETNSIIKEIYSLKLQERYTTSAVAISLMKISALLAVKCGISSLEHANMCEEFHNVLKVICESEEKLDS